MFTNTLEILEGTRVGKIYYKNRSTKKYERSTKMWKITLI